MTMTDKVLAALSFLGLIGFTGIVVVFVREIDLAIVVLMCLAMGIYDLWSTFRDKSGATANDNANGNASDNANDKS